MHNDPGLVGRFVVILVDIKHPLGGSMRGLSCGYFLHMGPGVIPFTSFFAMN